MADDAVTVEWEALEEESERMESAVRWVAATVDGKVGVADFAAGTYQSGVLKGGLAEIEDAGVARRYLAGCVIGDVLLYSVGVGMSVGRRRGSEGADASSMRFLRVFGRNIVFDRPGIRDLTRHCYHFPFLLT